MTCSAKIDSPDVIAAISGRKDNNCHRFPKTCTAVLCGYPPSKHAALH